MNHEHKNSTVMLRPNRASNLQKIALGVTHVLFGGI